MYTIMKKILPLLALMLIVALPAHAQENSGRGNAEERRDNINDIVLPFLRINTDNEEDARSREREREREEEAPAPAVPATSQPTPPSQPPATPADLTPVTSAIEVPTPTSSAPTQTYTGVPLLNTDIGGGDSGVYGPAGSQAQSGILFTLSLAMFAGGLMLSRQRDHESAQSLFDRIVQPQTA